MTRGRTGAADVLAIPGLVTLVIAVALPLTAVGWTLVGADIQDGGSDLQESAALLPVSIAWAFGVAALATLVGWLPGRAIRRGRVWLRIGLLASAIIPAYAIYFCWWRVLRPGTVIADAAIAGEWVQSLRSTVLAAALVASSWPIAAAVVALRRFAPEAAERVLLRLDSGSWRDRLACSFRADRWALALGCSAIAAILLGESASFDAAQVATVASEVRTLDASGSSIGSVMRAAQGSMAVALVLAVVLAISLARSATMFRSDGSDDSDEGGTLPTLGSQRAGVWLGGILVVVGTMLPLGLLAFDTALRGEGREFGTLHARASANSLLTAAEAALGGAAIALAATMLTIRGRTVLLGIAAAGSMLMLALPSTVVALAVAEIWQGMPLGNSIYDSHFVVSLAQTGRWSAVAITLGAWCGSSLPATARENWEVHGDSLGDFLRMARPTLTAAIIGGFLCTFALAATESSIAARLQPPGIDWLAATLLNAIHYQDPTAVSAALVWMALLSIACAATVMWVLAPRARRAPTALLLLSVLLVACDGTSVSEDSAASTETPAELPTDRVLGRAGHTDGRFYIPRAMAFEPTTGCLFVIDKDARVQRFSADGQFELGWRMPKFDKGKPTGVSVAPDGRIFVADTHEKRILIFDRDGSILGEFGSYGTGPGEFIYPCDVAFGRGGEVFVSEYGGNDRVQVFDANNQYLREFGRPGRGPGEFARPQSLVISLDGTEVFVADSCNHRIQVFDTDGHLRRILGRAGRGAGEFAYPYGVHILPDGSLIVAEFGNCRIQRINPTDGVGGGCWGGGVARVGRLNAPWAVDSCLDRLAVLDSANARVQSMALDSLR